VAFLGNIVRGRPPKNVHRGRRIMREEFASLTAEAALLHVFEEEIQHSGKLIALFLP
jgi:hypothetical protein